MSARPIGWPGSNRRRLLAGSLPRQTVWTMAAPMPTSANSRQDWQLPASMMSVSSMPSAAKAFETRRPYRNKPVGDGFTNVAIQGFYNEEEGFEPRFGIAHMGFLVNNSETLAQAIKGVATITERPATRCQSEIRMRDPQGNGCDLSQRGWEVDTDKWVSADAAV